MRYISKLSSTFSEHLKNNEPSSIRVNPVKFLEWGIKQSKRKNPTVHLICSGVPPEVALVIAHAASFLVRNSAFCRISINTGNMLASITACNRMSIKPLLFRHNVLCNYLSVTVGLKAPGFALCSQQWYWRRSSMLLFWWIPSDCWVNGAGRAVRSSSESPETEQHNR